MWLGSGKKFNLSEGPFFIFFDSKTKKERNVKNKENTFSKILFDIFCQSKNTWSIVNLKNHWTLTVPGTVYAAKKEWKEQNKMQKVYLYCILENAIFHMNSHPMSFGKKYEKGMRKIKEEKRWREN
jgi:hypothetical protein